MTATIAQQEGNIVLTIPRALIGDDFLRRIQEYVEYLTLVQQSKLNADQAWQLSEDIKTDWWKANRQRLLDKMKQA